ncbi:TRAP transporter small permease [Rhodobacter sp. SY28-1]|uniref:TRAP transporter small permease n=1 Tax=Rhodobacter sp. SY28-1 TaxID=2562317 RepID=UPI0010C1478D|nr:TRAP transporter small permease [Rhodobacter sp. SY28-1]
MDRILKGLRHAADAVAAGMLAAMFAIFLVQIAARYVFSFSLGWTVELSLSLWLWIVFWGSAFCLRPADHIRFDVLYLSVQRPVQRVFSVICAVAIVIAFVAAYLPTWDYVDFYKIKRSSTLRIPLNYVFIIYMAFMTMIILRYSRMIVDFLRGKHDLEGKITSYDLIDTETGR